MDRTRSLRGAGSFRRVLREGARGRSDGVTVVAVARGSDGPRVGLSVPGARNAVQRNRVKRRVRSALTALTLAGGTEIVVRAEPATSALAYQDLEEHLKRALTRAGALS